MPSTATAQPPTGTAPAPDLLPSYLRWTGPLLASLYAAGVMAHRSFSRPRRAPLPVLCVGNLTVGGTGKTPAVQYFARKLVERGYKPAVLMRGYREQAQDEAREMERGLSDCHVPVLLGGNRLASARKAREQGHDLVLLDDGFQHWKLARDLDIVLLDATDPFGGGHLLPYGRLREPVRGLHRAGAVILTRSDAIPTEQLHYLETRVRELVPSAVIACARHAPAGLRTSAGQPLPLAELRAQPLCAACGLGNPRGFLHTLQELGSTVREFIALPDHFEMSPQISQRLTKAMQHSDAKALVITEKDAAKLAKFAAAAAFPVWVVSVRFEVNTNEPALWELIAHALKKHARD